MFATTAGDYVGYLKRGTQVFFHETPRQTERVFVYLPWADESDTFVSTRRLYGERYVYVLKSPNSTHGQEFPIVKLTEGVLRSGLNRVIRTSPSGSAFARLDCGVFRVLEHRDGQLHIAADNETNVVDGWIEDAPPGQRDEGCKHAAVSAASARDVAPYGYRLVHELTSFVPALPTVKQGYYRKRQLAGRYYCEGFRFVPGAKPKQWDVQLEPNPLHAGITVKLHFAQRGHWLYHGERLFLVTEISDDRMRVIAGNFRRGEDFPDDQSSGLAFRANAGELWYFDRSACERDALSPPDIPKVSDHQSVSPLETIGFTDSRESGTLLDARTVTEVPIRLGNDGPWVGWLRARVDVKASVESALFFVETPLPSARTLVGPTLSKPRLGRANRHLEAYAPVTKEAAKAEPRQTEAASPELWGLHRTIATAPNAVPFATLECGRFRVLEKTATHWKILAEYDAGALTGWISAPTSNETDADCGPLSVDSGNPELAAAQETPYDYRRLFVAGTRFFQLVDSPEHCRPWRVVPSSSENGTLVSEEPETTDGVSEVAYRSYSDLITFGSNNAVWNFHFTGKMEQVESYRVVAMLRDRMVLTRVYDYEEASGFRIVSYDPNRVPTLFRSKIACETQRSKRHATQ